MPLLLCCAQGGNKIMPFGAQRLALGIQNMTRLESLNLVSYSSGFHGASWAVYVGALGEVRMSCQRVIADRRIVSFQATQIFLSSILSSFQKINNTEQHIRIIDLMVHCVQNCSKKLRHPFLRSRPKIHLVLLVHSLAA